MYNTSKESTPSKRFDLTCWRNNNYIIMTMSQSVINFMQQSLCFKLVPGLIEVGIQFHVELKIFVVLGKYTNQDSSKF